MPSASRLTYRVWFDVRKKIFFPGQNKKHEKGSGMELNPEEETKTSRTRVGGAVSVEGREARLERVKK